MEAMREGCIVSRKWAQQTRLGGGFNIILRGFLDTGWLYGKNVTFITLGFGDNITHLL